MLFAIGCAVVLMVLVVLRNVVIDWFGRRWQDAIDWNINPAIFVGLLFVTLFHYYKSWWQISMAVLTRDRDLLVRGVALNRTVWAIPYLYVLAFGRGYPWWVPAGVVLWMGIGLILFARNYKRRDYLTRITSTRFGRFVGREAHVDIAETGIEEGSAD